MYLGSYSYDEEDRLHPGFEACSLSLVSTTMLLVVSLRVTNLMSITGLKISNMD